MNKSKMIPAVTGGVFAVLALGLGYVTWSAMSAKTAALEGDDGSKGLVNLRQDLRGLQNKKPFPCVESVKAINEKRDTVNRWKEEAEKLVSRGDRCWQSTTPPAFKEFVIADAKRLSLLPGAPGRTLLAADFGFGPFRPYIIEGKLPEAAQLALLERQWDDIAGVIELMATNGVTALTDVRLKAAAVKEEPKKEVTKKNSRKKKKGKKALDAKAAEKARSITPQSYIFDFAVRPAAFVKLIDQLAVSERFIVVDDFTFSRGEKDALALALAAEEKKPDEAASGRRSRRRRGAAEEEKKEEAAKTPQSNIVTDPLIADPLLVSMTLTVYDFGTLNDEQKVEEESK